MLTSWLKRALPFMITLILGTGLWSIFGFQKSASRRGSGYHFYAHKRVVTSGLTPLRILSQPERRYTPEAQENRTTGVVRLLVQFNPDGTTTVIERLSSLPNGLTEEAVRVAEQTRFIPATLNGQPVAQTKEMNYIFSLSENDTMEP